MQCGYDQFVAVWTINRRAKNSNTAGKGTAGGIEHLCAQDQESIDVRRREPAITK